MAGVPFSCSFAAETEGQRMTRIAEMRPKPPAASRTPPAQRAFADACESYAKANKFERRESNRPLHGDSPRRGNVRGREAGTASVSGGV